MKVKLNSNSFHKMNKRLNIILLLILFLFPSFIFAQNKYNITFKIHGIEDSVVYIKTIYGNNQFIIDTLKKEKDGTFVLKKDNIHQGMGFVANKDYEMFAFLFDKSPTFSVEIDLLWNYQIKGCKDNDLYFEFQRANTLFRNNEKDVKNYIKRNRDKNINLDSIEIAYNKERRGFIQFQEEFYKNYPSHLMTKMVKALEGPKIPQHFFKGREIDTSKTAEFVYFFRTNYWNNFDFADNRLIATPYFFSKLKTYINELTVQQGDSIGQSLKEFVDLALKYNGKEYAQYAVNYFLTINRKSPFAYNEERFVGIVDRVVSSETTPWISPSEIEKLQIEANEIRPLLPGKQFVNLSEKDLLGNTYNLYDVKKKYTIVYFWSAGCKSCKENLEAFEKFYSEYKDKYDFEVYSIDLDYNLEESLAFSKNHPFKWIVLKSDPDIIKQKYNLDIDMTPDLYLLDSEKRIINHAPVYSQMEQTIKSIEKK